MADHPCRAGRDRCFDNKPDFANMRHHMNRRHFLATVSATTILPMPTFAAQDALRLKAETVMQQILPLGDGATSMLGFNGSMPGPELRVRRGERVNIEVENGLDEGTAVHWHGIRLENQMDGVPMLTQELIEPSDTKTYSFIPPDEGTYWYHSHYISHEQVARGMMGPLIVEDETPPDVDHQGAAGRFASWAGRCQQASIHPRASLR